MQITFAKMAAEAPKMRLEASPSELDEAQPVILVMVSPSLCQKSSGTYSSTAVIVR
jgi:hypothetical protein